MKSIKGLYVVVALLFALTLTVVTTGHPSVEPIATAGTVTAAEPTQPQGSKILFANDPYLIANVAEQASPGVVFVTAKWPAPPKDESVTPFNDPIFRFWFGDGFGPFQGPNQQGPKEAGGTGFIINKDGYILTNQHVVGNPGEGQEITVKITTPNYDDTVKAELVGADYQLDLAVLKIQRPKELAELPTVTLGDSDTSRPGEFVIAIGNPYGKQFEHTVTVGVLSAKGREISIPDYERNTVKYYQNLMQTDAAINPGNSGGPLLNIKGEVIGINTAVNAQAQGIGFAIPINTAKEVLDTLIRDGKIERGQPWIGIKYESAVTYFGVENADGVVVSEVVEGQPADKAGLKAGDYVYALNDEPLETAQQFAARVKAMQPGQKAIFHVKRQGERIDIPVIIGEKPEDETK